MTEKPPTPSTALQTYDGDRLAQARSLAGLTDEALRVRAVTAARDKSFEDLWALTLAYLSSDSQAGISASPHTLRSYRTGIRLFVEHAQDHAWNLLRPGRREPSLYVASLGTAGLKPATIQNRVAAATALYRALRWAGATEADPFTDVKRPRDRTRGIVKNPPYKADFVRAMVDAAAPDERALLLLMAHAGLRITEALSVEWQHVNLPGRRLLVAHGKGDKARLVPMSARLRSALLELQGDRTLPHHGPLFSFHAYSTAYERLQRLALQLGREHEFRGFHAGRKYAGTQLYAAVKDFTRVAGFLGHEQVDTTRRYVELPEDDLNDAVEQFD
ncbi:tyrosine-type recombinase/integrase [Deinococcus sonorensis]|uniref:Tyrosine-type recombinase/integrase n=2 Tax=Deinococcus sonorensis TaxID=309891 RepID=A0AAU7U9L1_9DEIO